MLEVSWLDIVKQVFPLGAQKSSKYQTHTDQVDTNMIQGSAFKAAVTAHCLFLLVIISNFFYFIVVHGES